MIIHSGICSKVQNSLKLKGWKCLLYSLCHTYKRQLDLLYFDQSNMKDISRMPKGLVLKEIIGNSTGMTNLVACFRCIVSFTIASIFTHASREKNIPSKDCHNAVRLLNVK